jgi:GrpB-like predicted nucleotidyltransferase (UPF0157 family)
MVIVDYDTRWPALFERERQKIMAALAGKAKAIEHIGSTAVPGLGAKPIIDILAGVAAASDFDASTRALQSIGYTHDPYPQFPERRFLRDGPMGAGPHHLHMTEYMSDFWQKNVLFRDWLRSHRQDAQAYLSLKKTLAARFGQDRDQYERYTDGKNDFIQAVLARARSR